MIKNPQLEERENGIYSFSLAVPRGVISFVTLLVSGIFSLMLVGLILPSLISGEENLPRYFYVSAMISSAVFFFVLYDRTSARKAGIHLLFQQDGEQVHYRILKGKVLVDEGRLENSQLAICTLTLPGRAGETFVPTYGLSFVTGKQGLPEAVETDLGEAYILIRAANIETLMPQVERFYNQLHLKMDELQTSALL